MALPCMARPNTRRNLPISITSILKRPRDGTLTLAARQGGFDSLNPFIFKGQAAEGWRRVFEPLTKRSQDEPFSLYGLLAEEVEMDPARKWIRFRLRKGASFADGEPVKVSDILWSWETLRDKGRPNHPPVLP